VILYVGYTQKTRRINASVTVIHVYEFIKIPTKNPQQEAGRINIIKFPGERATILRTMQRMIDNMLVMPKIMDRFPS